MLRDALSTANSWTAEDWGGFEALLVSIQGCVRGAFLLGMSKISFLDKIPVLLARLNEPGVRDRCLEQFHAAPVAAHHRVSREFLEPGHESGLRPLVDALNHEASNMSARSKSEVDSLARSPIDDAVGEGPHARGKAEWDRAHGADFPWISSTMRLSQNLHDVDTLAPILDSLDLQEEWDRYSCIVQPARRAYRRKHITQGKLQNIVYKLGHFEGGMAYSQVTEHTKQEFEFKIERKENLMGFFCISNIA